MSMLKKVLLASLFAGLLAPSLADARPAKGYARAVRGAVSAATGVKASQVRYRSRLDPSHDASDHQHITSHEPRLVTFRAGRATGKAKTDTAPIGGATHVFDLKLDPIAPNQ
jgi:hypothetical protein